MKTKYKNNDHLPKYYKGDDRYEKVKEQMDLLGITDVSTNRQYKNGTIVWQLPIKNNWKKGSYIEVASFATGYVRNQNSGYSNYQLNKRCQSEPQYYPEYKWCERKNKSIATGKYNMYTTKACVLIPSEIDRLEYLMSYCLKNYYVKHANFVADGKYVPEWYHNNCVDKEKGKTKLVTLGTYDCGHYGRINDLEEKLGAMTDARDCLLYTSPSPRD